MERAKILVVDDESRMRKLVKDFLTREGYTVLEAGDGMEAMDLFYEDKEIALIILDVMICPADINFTFFSTMFFTSICLSNTSNKKSQHRNLHNA